MTDSRDPAFRHLIASQINAASSALRRSQALRLRREFDLSEVEWRTILLIEFMQPVRLRDVAAESAADKAQISRIVTALVKRGLIVRQEYASDARSAFLSLSTSGKDLAARLSQLAAQYEAELRTELGQAGAEQLLRTLALVRDKAMQSALAEERLGATARR